MNASEEMQRIVEEAFAAAEAAEQEDGHDWIVKPPGYFGFILRDDFKADPDPAPRRSLWRRVVFDVDIAWRLTSGRYGGRLGTAVATARLLWWGWTRRRGKWRDAT